MNHQKCVVLWSWAFLFVDAVLKLSLDGARKIIKHTLSGPMSQSYCSSTYPYKYSSPRTKHYISLLINSCRFLRTLGRIIYGLRFYKDFAPMELWNNKKHLIGPWPKFCSSTNHIKIFKPQREHLTLIFP